MFEKQKLQFSNKSVFGYAFKNNIDDCFCKTSKMLFAGKINPDGTVDESRADTFKKSELWSYIYYMYYYNNSDLDEFKAMRTKKTGQANAILFYDVVKTVVDRRTVDINSAHEQSVKPLNTLYLIKFINNIIADSGDELVNPVIDYLKMLLSKKALLNLKGIKLVTGSQSGKFEIVDE
jgi:hypothetical protein